MCLAYNAAMQMSSNMIKIKRGLDIPLAGAPTQELDCSLSTRAVALLGPDYQGMKPTMAVQVGDSVKRGQLLFTDKKCEGVNTPRRLAGGLPPSIVARSGRFSPSSSRSTKIKLRVLISIRFRTPQRLAQTP